MVSLLKKFFGSRNQRIIRGMAKTVSQINALEPQMQALSDAELRAKTDEFRQQLKSGATLASILPQAFAVVRETSQRVLKMRHFDVQLIGGIVLHQGNIAEMKTGEGKTLGATLPAYLNALSGKGVHIVTVNDYLAQRDADWMRPIYDFLGLTVGVNKTTDDHEAKRQAYAADITYGTNNEFGFDYLRDNMAFSLEDKVQRDLNFAIVDEVDSILIDEARTPLLISGPAEDSSELYRRMNAIIPKLKRRETEDGPGDYYLEEKERQAYFTEEGHQRVEDMLAEIGMLQAGDSLYSPVNISLMHHLNAALKAHTLFHRDVEYVVNDKQEIVIVDEHTGRLMPGRRWSDGLHQAVEAKEGVSIQHENQTLASITFQNYFRLYDKLAGMTGTADTEAYEFQQIYGLEVVVIPTNKPMIRQDITDKVYVNAKDKFAAILQDIKDCMQRKQPVLVGTIAIETSEKLSNVLKQASIPHQVLNAKYHAQEAKIVAQAGRPGAVTIATNMAGRGTDIVLGGNPEATIAELGDEATPEKVQQIRDHWQQLHNQVVEAGGLRIVGTERHESRRIDNQLRGRSGRQGDPGSSQFYLSLEDNLMRIFASDRISGLMQRGMEPGEALESSLVHKVIEMAQRKVEGHNFDIRKQLLEYDDVANDQRKVIYAQRNELMATEDVSDTINSIRDDVIDKVIDACIPPQSMEEQWDVPGLQAQLHNDFGLQLDLKQMLAEDDSLHEEKLRDVIQQRLLTIYTQKEQEVGAEVMRHLEKSIMLQALDTRWREHLVAMDHLRQGIHLRGYAQKNPKDEYKREAFMLFTSMLEALKHDVISMIYLVEVHTEEEVAAIEEERRRLAAMQNMQYNHADGMAALAEEEAAVAAEGGKVIPFTRKQPKVGRNDPCPCGSGKKYKHCHGQA